MRHFFIWILALGILVAGFAMLSEQPAIPIKQPAPTAEITTAATSVPTRPLSSPTATSEPSATATFTVTPSATPSATFTQTATPAPTFTFTPVAPPDYLLQPGSPAYLRSITNAGLDCSWQGVAGQVFDVNGDPMLDLIVTVEGQQSGQAFEGVSVTGAAKQYGPAGFEVMLGERPVVSTEPFYITVMDLAGEPLSYPIPFDTYGDCSKNLVLINFVANNTP